jgi:F420-non-reducing hydrogenase small subunit
MPDKDKKKLSLAVYWGAACGGCCVSVLDLHEKLLDVSAIADIVFWPIALDVKYKDVEAFKDSFIDITLYNGAIRNEENEHIAKLLRQKSKVLIAYGSCAYMGGTPGLANFSTKEALFNRVYIESESTENPEKIFPQTEFKVNEDKIELPVFYNDVRTLNNIVDLDYYR